MRKNDAFVAKIVNTRLTKGFMVIFAPAESLPSPATLDQNKIFGKSTKAKNPQKPPQKKQRAIASKASGKSNKITEGRNKQKHFWRPIGVQGKLSENQRQHFFVKLIFECVLIL